MKYLKTYEGWNPFRKEHKPPERMTTRNLVWLGSTLGILNHAIFEREIRTRDVGQLTNREERTYIKEISEFDFVVMEGLFWKYDFKKMLEHPRIKGFWTRKELLHYYFEEYNNSKDHTDFDTTGEISGGYMYLHLIDIHRMIGIEETMEIYKELNS